MDIQSSVWRECAPFAYSVKWAGEDGLDAFIRNTHPMTTPHVASVRISCCTLLFGDIS